MIDPDLVKPKGLCSKDDANVIQLKFGSEVGEGMREKEQREL